MQRTDAPCSWPPAPPHSVPSPNTLGSPEACPGPRLPTRKPSSRADPPSPHPGERVCQPPTHTPTPSSSALHQAWAWAITHCETPVPRSPTCTPGWRPPLFLSWQKIRAWALWPRWPVADGPVDFESYLIPGFCRSPSPPSRF